MNNKDITQGHLKALLVYDCETGLFMWKFKSGRYGRIPAGTIAGTSGKSGQGYIEIQLLGRLRKAHRLAWLYMTGSWPKNEIDHINRVRSDNRFSNLRESTLQQNLKNKCQYKSNTSGYAGVTWHKHLKRWQARISNDSKRFHLGYFETPEAANSVYLEEKKRLHNLG
ncbi:MAG: HNH endonuclease [Thiotrichaceae bacterium]